MKPKDNTKYEKNKRCRTCGNLCYGNYCRECFLGKKRFNHGAKNPVTMQTKRHKRGLSNTELLKNYEVKLKC